MSLGKIVSKITRKKAWQLIYVFLGIYPCMSCMLKFWYTFMITYSNFWYTFMITCSNFMVIVKICTGLQHNINWITQHISPKISKSGCGLRGKSGPNWVQWSEKNKEKGFINGLFWYFVLEICLKQRSSGCRNTWREM